MTGRLWQHDCVAGRFVFSTDDMDKTISEAQIRKAAQDAYDAAKNLTGGANAEDRKSVV